MAIAPSGPLAKPLFRFLLSILSDNKPLWDVCAMRHHTNDALQELEDKFLAESLVSREGRLR
jgi:hypothetical protein